MVGLDEGDVEFHLQNNCNVPLVVGRCVMTPHSNRRGDVVFYPSVVHTSKLVTIISVSLKPRGSMFFF